MLNVAVLCSKRAPGLEALLQRDEFRVVCVMTTEAEFPECGAPVIAHPIKGMRRRDYDTDTAALLRSLEVDAVICLGYLYILTEPMLSAFPDRFSTSMTPTCRSAASPACTPRATRSSPASASRAARCTSSPRTSTPDRSSP